MARVGCPTGDFLERRFPQWTIAVTSSQVVAQTTEAQKAEAERLLNLCREHLNKNQAEAAIQSCQQAVTATVK